MNPAPDADLHSVGKESFDWIVDTVANLAVSKAQKPTKPELRWASFIGAEKKSTPKKPPAKKSAARKVSAK
jgi:hypothetical protein